MTYPHYSTTVRALYQGSRLPRYFLSIVYHAVVASELAGFTILIRGLSNSSDCDLHPRARFFGLILFGFVLIEIIAITPPNKNNVASAEEFFNS